MDALVEKDLQSLSLKKAPDQVTDQHATGLPPSAFLTNARAQLSAMKELYYQEACRRVLTSSAIEHSKLVYKMFGLIIRTVLWSGSG